MYVVYSSRLDAAAHSSSLTAACVCVCVYWYLDQLGRTYVRAVAEAEVEQHKRAVVVLVRHRLPVHVDQGERPAKGRLARGRHLSVVQHGG